MTFPRPFIPLLGAALALAACGGRDPVAENAGDSAALPAPESSNASDPSGAPPPANAPAASRPSPDTDPAQVRAAADFPAALIGRWGMSPADCVSTHGDAKGLLVIGRGDMRFHESRAVPVGNIETSSDFLSGDFAFEGEGMTWRKFQSLQLRERRLVRTESSPMATYTYARCG